jgi:pyridinium-3,5-bisthiocarboxylic acid mononucleotide nickel chelatase
MNLKVLYYDCFCGISGDMNLGALLDLGVDKDYLLQELGKLPVDSEYEMKINKAVKMGITGTKVDVILKHPDHDQHSHSDMPHSHDDHSHDGHSHTNEEVHVHQHSDGAHEHQHRNLQDIERIINGSGLNDQVKKLSLDMFERIARAEAKIHGKSLEEVHFHEVGAIDSIVDMVGAAIAIDYLKVERIMASPVQVGGGFVKCAHGLFPVPAPATMEILKDIPIKSGLVPFETTTPTGAAILAANVEKFSDKMEFSVERIGYGIGNRDLEVPNVLRVYLGTAADGLDEIDEQYILETNIDDMNPELYSYIEERLFEKGALDVFRTPIIMKKARSAIKLSILVNKKQAGAVQGVIFRETTSIGMRKFRVEKIMLQREFLALPTEYGEIKVKISYYEGKPVKYKAEYEDCRNAAVKNQVPIVTVYRTVDQEMEKRTRSEK